MRERVALAGLAEQQRASGVGLKRARVRRERRDQDDRRAGLVDRDRGAARERVTAPGLEHRERAVRGVAHQARGEPDRVVVDLAQRRGRGAIGHRLEGFAGVSRS
ncbi:MAG: hypothetical protein U1E86_12220 [Burkholderiaceae bacterium]